MTGRERMFMNPMVGFGAGRKSRGQPSAERGRSAAERGLAGSELASGNDAPDEGARCGWRFAYGARSDASQKVLIGSSIPCCKLCLQSGGNTRYPLISKRARDWVMETGTLPDYQGQSLIYSACLEVAQTGRRCLWLGGASVRGRITGNLLKVLPATRDLPGDFRTS